jgi:oligopeptide/dipeptide ABC transporter ATP-binding protein
MADRVLVMYAGRKVEEGPVREVFRNPQHPYTAGLLGLTLQRGGRRSPRLTEIRGAVPSFRDMPQGCAFASRCDKAEGVCREIAPTAFDAGRDHEVACWAAELEGEPRVVAIGR